MGDPVLRQPLESEAATCADLVIMSAPELFSYVYGKTGEALLKLFIDFFSTPGTTYSKENITVFDKDGKIGGLILAFPVTEERRLMKGEIGLLRRRSGGPVRGELFFVRMAWRMLLAIRYPPLKKDEFFVSDLAVFPEYRGQGVARGLLAHSVETAVRVGLDKVSLFVETDNLPALAVYEKFGFRKSDTRMLPRRANDYGLYGFHKMVKNID